MAATSRWFDRRAAPWLLFANEDGDQFAVTVECPDYDLPPSCDSGSLRVDRGPLLLLFNGDAPDIPGWVWTGDDQDPVVGNGSSLSLSA